MEYLAVDGYVCVCTVHGLKRDVNSMELEIQAHISHTRTYEWSKHKKVKKSSWKLWSILAQLKVISDGEFRQHSMLMNPRSRVPFKYDWKRVCLSAHVIGIFISRLL